MIWKTMLIACIVAATTFTVAGTSAADKGTAEKSVDFALYVMCPRGDASYETWCQNAHGNYGFGAIRPCSRNFVAGPDTAGFVNATGACSNLAPVNLTRAAARHLVDPVLP